jgi:WD40 repeat protein
VVDEEQGKDDNDTVGVADKVQRAKEIQILHKQVNNLQKAADMKAKAQLSSLERAVGDVKGGPTGSAGRAIEVESYIKKERTDLEALGKQILAALENLAARMQRLEEKIDRMNQNIEALQGRDISTLISDRASVLSELLYRQSPGAVDLPLEMGEEKDERSASKGTLKEAEEPKVRYAVKTLYDALQIDYPVDKGLLRSFVLEGVADSGKTTVLLQLHQELHKEMERRNAEEKDTEESKKKEAEEPKTQGKQPPLVIFYVDTNKVRVDSHIMNDVLQNEYLIPIVKVQEIMSDSKDRKINMIVLLDGNKTQLAKHVIYERWGDQVPNIVLARRPKVGGQNLRQEGGHVEEHIFKMARLTRKDWTTLFDMRAESIDNLPKGVETLMSTPSGVLRYQSLHRRSDKQLRNELEHITMQVRAASDGLSKRFQQQLYDEWVQLPEWSTESLHLWPRTAGKVLKKRLLEKPYGEEKLVNLQYVNEQALLRALTIPALTAYDLWEAHVRDTFESDVARAEDENGQMRPQIEVRCQFLQRIAVEFAWKRISSHKCGPLNLAGRTDIELSLLDSLLQPNPAYRPLLKAVGTLFCRYTDLHWRFTDGMGQHFFFAREWLHAALNPDLSKCKELVLALTLETMKVFSDRAPFDNHTSLKQAMADDRDSLASAFEEICKENRRLQCVAPTDFLTAGGHQLFTSFQDLVINAIYLSRNFSPNLVRQNDDALQMIVGKVAQSSHARHAMHCLIIVSKLAATGLTGASATAATILNAAKEVLANMPWSGVDLCGADLSEATLTCSDLRGANLERVKLRKADIRDARLDGAKLQHIQLRTNLALLAASKDSSENLSAVRWCVFHERTLIGACSDGLRTWRENQQEPFQHLAEHRTAVCGLALSPDSKVLVSSDTSGSIYAWQVGPSGRVLVQRRLQLSFQEFGKDEASSSTKKTPVKSIVIAGIDDGSGESAFIVVGVMDVDEGSSAEVDPSANTSKVVMWYIQDTNSGGLVNASKRKEAMFVGKVTLQSPPGFPDDAPEFTPTFVVSTHSDSSTKDGAPPTYQVFIGGYQGKLDNPVVGRIDSKALYNGMIDTETKSDDERHRNGTSGTVQGTAIVKLQFSASYMFEKSVGTEKSVDLETKINAMAVLRGKSMLAAIAGGNVLALWDPGAGSSDSTASYNVPHAQASDSIFKVGDVPIDLKFCCTEEYQGGSDVAAWLAVSCTRGGIKIIAYRRAKPRSPATSFTFQREIRAHEGFAAYKMCLDRSGSRLASCGGDGRVRVWQIEDMISEESALDNDSVHCMVPVGPDFFILGRQNKLEVRSWTGEVVSVSEAGTDETSYEGWAAKVIKDMDKDMLESQNKEVADKKNKKKKDEKAFVYAAATAELAQEPPVYFDEEPKEPSNKKCMHVAMWSLGDTAAKFVDYWYFDSDTGFQARKKLSRGKNSTAAIQQLAFAEPFPFLAAACVNGVVEIWQEYSRKDGMLYSPTSTFFQPVETAFDMPVICMRWHWHEGEQKLFLYAGASQNKVYRWMFNLVPNQETDTIKAKIDRKLPEMIAPEHTRQIRAMAIGVSLIGNTLLASAAGEIQVWSIPADASGDSSLTPAVLPSCFDGIDSEDTAVSTLEFVAPSILAAGGCDGAISFFFCGQETSDLLKKIKHCHNSGILHIKVKKTPFFENADQMILMTSDMDGSVVSWELQGLGSIYPSDEERQKNTLAGRKTNLDQIRLKLVPLTNLVVTNVLCSGASFEGCLGLSSANRAVLAQLGGKNLDRHTTVTVDTSNGQSHGLDFNHISGVIELVSPGGAVSQWNVENPEEISKGDQIVSVNGKRKMLDVIHELGQPQELVIVFVRSSEEQVIGFELEPPPCCPSARPVLRELAHCCHVTRRNLDKLSSIKVRHSAKADCIPQHFEFACTCRALENIQTILRAALYRQPLLIEGSASTGKTSAVVYAAHLLQQPILQLSVTPNTTYTEIIGGIGFSDEDDGMVFQQGVLTQALENGCWLLLDEANLATDSVLSVLEDVLVDRRLEIPAFLVAADGRYKQRLNADGKLIIPMHDSFRLFATQNPPLSSKYRSTRHQLGESLLSHFLCVVFEEAQRMEMEQIVQSHLTGSFKESEASFSLSKKQTYFLLENGFWCVAHEAPWNRDMERQIRASRIKSDIIEDEGGSPNDVISTTQMFLSPSQVIQATLVFRQPTKRIEKSRNWL